MPQALLRDHYKINRFATDLLTACGSSLGSNTMEASTQADTERAFQSIPYELCIEGRSLQITLLKCCMEFGGHKYKCFSKESLAKNIVLRDT